MSKKYMMIAVSAILAAVAVIICITFALGGGGAPIQSRPVEGSKSGDDLFCLMVLGKDKVSGLTDVMMLVSFDPKEDRICVMQIPRDTYAEYGDGSHSKLNTAAKILGGERELCDYLSGAFGVYIDGYLSLELEGFRRIIDAIGGVEIELDRTLYYNDPEQGLYIHLKKGKQTLDGEKAEMLVRYRSGYVRGDLDRLDMQKQFLAALFTSLKKAVTPSNAYQLASALLPYIKTDVELPMAVGLGLEALSVESSALGFLTLPGEDAVSHKTGASYYVMALEPTSRVIAQYFSKDGTEVDHEGLFEHPTYERFREIYGREGEPSVSFADEFE